MSKTLTVRVVFAASRHGRRPSRAGRPASRRGCGGRLAWALCAAVALGWCFVESAPGGPPGVATDLGLVTGFQDGWFGHLKRGRACVAADFDLDGRVDFYIGNPGDESFVIRNAPDLPEFPVLFEFVQVLLDENHMAWGASAADYDNDGDYDIFITCGANEGCGFCHLFKNMWVETQKLQFVEVSTVAGIRGPIPPGETEPVPVANANAVWGDYDRDGHVDVFVNTNIHPPNLCGLDPEYVGRNTLWKNNGDGTFTDVTDAVGLGTSFYPTRHSTFLDIDNDGDIDLYENNMRVRNILWQNQLVETGTAGFVDVTDEFSPEGEDVGVPLASFVSAAADFNNDGWQDIMVWMHAGEEDGETPYGNGNAIFLNQNGTGFVNIADEAGINDPGGGPEPRTMGCQVGDLNGDGVPDLFLGTGYQSEGLLNFLYISDSPVGEDPHYVDMKNLTDFPAPEHPGLPDYPPYPYRTHGTAFVDVDGDGSLEMAVANGGPAFMGDEVREPNRLFKFNWNQPAGSFQVRPIGNCTDVSRDAIGTRFALEVSNSGRPGSWVVYNTLFGGSAFSAQNGFVVHFGIFDADTIHSLTTTWSDGEVTVTDEGLIPNDSIVVRRRLDADVNEDGVVNPLDFGFVRSRFGCAVGAGDAGCDLADANRDGVVDPLDIEFVLSRLGQGCPAANS